MTWIHWEDTASLGWRKGVDGMLSHREGHPGWAETKRNEKEGFQTALWNPNCGNREGHRKESSYKNQNRQSKTKILKQNKKHTHTEWERDHGIHFLSTNYSRSTLECGWYILWYSIGESWFSLSQKVSMEISFLVRSENLCPIVLLSTSVGIFGLNLCRSWARCHGLCEFIPVLLCLEDFVSVELPTASLKSFCPLLGKDPWVSRRGRDSMKTFPFRKGYFRASHFLHIAQLCISLLINTQILNVQV